MLAQITGQQFIEWMAFYELDPWGDQRADLRMAEMLALTVNMNLRKGKKPATIQDFMHYAEKPDPKPMSQAESVAYIQRALRGTKIKRTH